MSSLNLKQRRAFKRKHAEDQSNALAKLGTACAIAQLCAFDPSRVRVHYAQEHWRTGGQTERANRSCVVPSGKSRLITYTESECAPATYEVTIDARISWTASRSLFLCKIVEFRVHCIDLLDQVHLREHLQQGQAIAQRFLNVLNQLGARFDEETGTFYISVVNPDARESTYQTLIQFLQSQQLSLYIPDNN